MPIDKTRCEVCAINGRTVPAVRFILTGNDGHQIDTRTTHPLCAEHFKAVTAPDITIRSLGQ